MQRINNFSEANDLLRQFVPQAKKYHAAVVSLQKMISLMDALGNPQNSYKVIHVAGTSGKTSTAYYIAAFLHQAGFNVGLTVSPHVDEVNERVQIQLRPLAEAEFCKQLSAFMDVLDTIPLKPSYFELLVAFAYWQFAQSKVDYAVIEVGMGGKLDATNVIGRQDKVCVITDIGLDHTEYLGDTLAKIAAEKAGIVQTKNDVFTYLQNDEIMDVIRNTVVRQHAKLHSMSEPADDHLPVSLPLFQKRNWYLAQQVFNFITTRDSIKPLNKLAVANVITAYIPARMEIVTHANKTIIIDGSHNPQKLHALMSSIKDRYPNQMVAALVSFGAGDDSRYKGGMDEIMQVAHSVIATTFALGQDAPRSPVDPKDIVAYAKKQGFTTITAVIDPVEAFHQLLKAEDPIILVTGSFFLLNHIRPLVKLKGNT